MMALNTMDLMTPRKKNGGERMRAKIRIVNKTLKSTSIPPPVTGHGR